MVRNLRILLRLETALIPSFKLYPEGLLQPPKKIAIVGNYLALAWESGEECCIESYYLRLHSPSAEQAGEKDIFGRKSGGSSETNFSNVRLLDFHRIGNYAVRLRFSDGHSTGIYSWEILRSLADSYDRENHRNSN